MPADTLIPITPVRQRIIGILAAKPQMRIDDEDGQATAILLKETGHRTTNALSGVLMEMEKGGLVTRETAGRRTYSIALTDAGARLAVQPDRPSPVLPPAPESNGNGHSGGIDYDLLAGVLLKKVVTAAQGDGKAADTKERIRRSEERLNRAAARVAELEAELVATRARLAELEELNTRIADLNKTFEHNNQALMSQLDKVRNSPGTPIEDLISAKDRRELDKLMRQLPGVR